MEVQTSGVARVAVWEEHPELTKFDDLHAQYSRELFYDFSKPLKLLDSPYWSRSIDARLDKDFFILSPNDFNRKEFY